MQFLSANTWVLALAAISPFFAIASEAPDFTVQVQEANEANEANEELVFTATPPPKHHINQQAPATLEVMGVKEKIKPTSKSEHEAKFILKTKAQDTTANITLYLCDEANTYCEKHQVAAVLPQKWVSKKIDARRPDAPENTYLATAEKQTATAAVYATAAPTLHGFIVNNPEKALQLAATQNKPLLIDFFGIWCPPCNLLDEQVFPSKEFKNAATNFVLLKLDADKDISWKLKSKYQVSGYPTLIFANAQGEEIDRIVGFLPKEKFTEKMRQVLKNKTRSQEEMRRLADTGDKQAIRAVGEMHLERKEYDQAIGLFSKDPAFKEKLWQAKVAKQEAQLQASSQPNSQKAALLAVYEEILKANPHSAWSMLMRTSYADLLEDLGEKEKHQAALEELASSATKLLTTKKNSASIPLDDSTDLSATDLWAVVADAHEKLGQVEKAKKAYLEAATLYKKAILLSGQSASRGYHLELAYCLWKAGLSAQAEKIYQRFEEQYPQEFTFYFSHARMFYELKNYEKAKELSEKALRYSYGDNKLRVAEVFAKSLYELGKKKEALAVLKTTLQATTLPSDSGIRTHRYYNKLKALSETWKQPTS